MARITWHDAGSRTFETGIDRGVLYVGAADGVPWNGLAGVSETPSGGGPRPYYIDGFKYANLSAAEEFEATLKAYGFPEQFAVCDGSAQPYSGLFLTQQPRKSFGLSYRTLLGNDLDGLLHGYKIHLVYNALASPSTRENTTLGSEVSPTTNSWKITTRPPVITGYRPTAHFVIDSRTSDPLVLSQVEDILYGSEAEAPRLPDPDELMTIFSS